MPNSNLQTAYQYFLSQGDSPSASAGIAAGLFAESNLDPSVVNAYGATGIAQWLGARLAALESLFGPNPNLQQQLQFVQMELTGQVNDQAISQSNAQIILGDTSPSQALSDFINLFERPKAGSQTTGDISRGTNALNSLNIGSSAVTNPLAGSTTGLLTSAENFGVDATQYIEGGIGGLLGVPSNQLAGGATPSVFATSGANTAVGAATGGIGTAIQNAGSQVSSSISGALNPLTGWLSGLTSGSTVTRITVGIVAVILLGAGIFFLAGNKQTTINLGNVARLRGAVG